MFTTPPTYIFHPYDGWETVDVVGRTAPLVAWVPPLLSGTGENDSCRRRGISSKNTLESRESISAIRTPGRLTRRKVDDVVSVGG